MSLYEDKEGIYLGSRGNDFKEFIDGILKKGKLRGKYRKMLTDDSSMQIYAAAFTSELVDANNNYQVLEQVGDLTGNKFIVNYMYQRFPQLDCTEGVKVVARLRINYGAKESFFEIARKLGFWPFISATNDMRQRKMKTLLEDVFEAFLGATERILDRKKRVGVGYAIVYDILATIFDEMDISLRYEDLYDAKTRLKELFDVHQDKLGSLVYKEERSDMITVSTVYRVEGRNYIKIGKGSAALKSDAQQNAAAAGLETLNKQGWVKPVPPIYKKFNNYNEKKVDCDSTLVDDIKTSSTDSKNEKTSKKTKIDELRMENKKIQDQIFKKVSEMDIPETITYSVKVPKYNDDMGELEFCFKDQYPRAQHLEMGTYYEDMDIKFNKNSIRVTYSELNREELNDDYQFIGFSDHTCYHDDCDFSRNNNTYFCSQHQRVIDEKEVNDILYKRLKQYNDSIKHRLYNIEKDLTPPKKIRGDVCVPNDTCENDTYDWILTLKK